MRDALSHAALSTFICSAAAAAAFYAALISDIVVIKCFGVFAGTTMLVNYLLMVTWLPASLIVMHKYLNPCFERVCPTACLVWIRKMWAWCAILPNFVLMRGMPRLVMMFKYCWISLFTIIFLGSCVVVFYEPGVTLPKRNPLQIFKASNPMEWYDEYATEYFSFANDFFKQPMEVVIVFGMDAADNNRMMEPDDPSTSSDEAVFTTGTNFVLNMTFLEAVNEVCHQLNSAKFMASPISCFPDQFFTWSINQDCSRKKNISGDPCCNYKQSSFVESRDLVWCLAESTKTFDVTSGGPIFTMEDLQKTAGFLLYYEANYTWSADHGLLKKFFSDVNGGLNQILQKSNLETIRDGWFMTTTVYALLWYDLQLALLRGTAISVLVAVGVALVVAALTLRAFIISILTAITVIAITIVVIACLVIGGWHLNIVESILMILTVGLGFHVTLKYAVAYQLSPKGSREEKVSTVLQFMGTPVFLAFFTTFLAGVVMLPSSILPFYHMGIFMLLIGQVSWLCSTLFFLSLLAVVGPEDCEWVLLKNIMRTAANNWCRRQASPVASNNSVVEGTELNTRVHMDRNIARIAAGNEQRIGTVDGK